MALQDYAKEIGKTGFVLEHKVTTALEDAGWHVISNKYYEDDIEGTVREIDLLAYKIGVVDGIRVFTVLIISCKKNEENAWAFLSREIHADKPNSNWWPLYIWTNNKAVEFYTEEVGFPKSYHAEIEFSQPNGPLALPEVEVFAFQEMSRANGRPQNDKNIYNSITALIKAQAYEFDTAGKRNRRNSIYQFNLMTVFEGEMARLHFDGANITSTSTESEFFISRYIIKKRESFSRIRFVSWDKFQRCLPEYEVLHTENCRIFPQKEANFYRNALASHEKVDVFLGDFRAYVSPAISACFREVGEEFDKDFIGLSFDKSSAVAVVELSASKQVIAIANESARARKSVERALRKFYRYDGMFKFDEESIPF